MEIFVGSLPFKITEEGLKELFEAYGEVRSVKIILDKFTRQNKGFGFVDMPNAQEALSAIKALDKSTLLDREIIVNRSEPKKEETTRGDFKGGNANARGFRANTPGSSEPRRDGRPGPNPHPSRTDSSSTPYRPRPVSIDFDDDAPASSAEIPLYSKNAGKTTTREFGKDAKKGGKDNHKVYKEAKGKAPKKEGRGGGGSNKKYWE